MTEKSTDSSSTSPEEPGTDEYEYEEEEEEEEGTVDLLSWAEENGIPVTDRGPIPDHIIEVFFRKRQPEGEQHRKL